MRAHNKVIWSEGLFLQPEHFQQQARYFESLARQTGNNHWGMRKLSVDSDSLQLGKFSLLEATGLFNDGTQFNAPSGDVLPTPLTLSEADRDKIIYLALPDEDKQGITVGNTNERYQAELTTVISNIDAREVEIDIGRLRLQFILEDNDLSRFTAIAIAKVADVSVNGVVSLDTQFIPTCVQVSASTQLHTMINEIQQLINHRANMLSHRLTDVQQSASAEIADFMLLQLVNRAEPLFNHLAHKQTLHPETLYEAMTQLMGEIATFTSDNRRSKAAPAYVHSKPLATFKPIMKALRYSLSMMLEQNATSIRLEERQYGVWVGELADKTVLESSDMVLAVYADLPTENLRNTFPSQIKIASIEQIRQLVSRALPGIDVQPIPVAPRQIPYHANFAYFALNKNHPYFSKLATSAGIAFHVAGNFPGLKLELWAIRG